ncbi:uncharacterized protein H6S33_011858 [Morchella sextelata]|uniref:uncharacterized protein n=1 Tax=Morchella sextelata TaxID=1174677 RepID=UPI001D04A9DD|nr:uncharacterized protein H6S33_011858 [Morchella sextelata]KAH0610331.1 hypothetical protein H6S33_011858 [Morchella sextelata]
MLRLSSAAPARAIANIARSQYALKQQQRYLADIKSPQSTPTSTKPGEIKTPGNGIGSKGPLSEPQPVRKSASPVTPTSASPSSPTKVVPPTPAGPKTQTAPPVVTPTSSPAVKTATVTPSSPAEKPVAAAAAPPPSPPVKPASDSVPPPPPGGKPAKKTHKFRNFIITLTLLTGLSFGGGVFYSLKSDNFHDFFTEYIPFGEEAVLYFEEREFRRRFPNALSRLIPAKQDLPKVTIPRSSGATWRNHEEEKPKTTDVGKHGPHISAKGTKDQQAERAELTGGPKANASEQKPAEATVLSEKAGPTGKDSTKVEAVTNSGKANGGSNYSISPVEMGSVNDPVVQDLVKVVNTIISLVNNSGSAKSFEDVISSAKSELSHLNAQIATIKGDLEKATEEKLKSKDVEFASAAQSLVSKVNSEVSDLEHKWKEEFEHEREKIIQSYRERLGNELERSHKIAEQRLRNELLEQAIEMKRKFIGEIEERVETERNGRLGKLQELTNSVDELSKLSTSWADIIDANLNTQKLHVALEAVRAAYESPEQPKPFLREVAALKEVAGDDEVVSAAIASINPRAYQEGVPTQTQLVDRFRRVAEEVRKAALLPEDAGFAGHASSWLLSKVLFRKQGLAQGNDVESILTRTETFLEEGDIDSAAREMNQLSGWSRKLANDWLKEARLLLEVKQAVDVIAAEARLQSLRVQEQN